MKKIINTRIKNILGQDGDINQNNWFISKLHDGKNMRETPSDFVDYISDIQGPLTSIIATDINGNSIIGANGDPARIPAGFSIHNIISRAEEIKSSVDLSDKATSDLISMGNPFDTVLPGDMLTDLSRKVPDLVKFKRGNEWDIQRIGQPDGKINPNWRDISTIAIGIYAAASGMTLDEIMEVQTEYVRVFGGHWREEELDSVWTLLPKINVRNTEIGFNLYKNGLIK